MRIRRIFLQAGLALVLLAPALGAREAPVSLPTRPADPTLWGSFIGCISVLEQWTGPSLPDWIVHSRVLGYPARTPRYDDLGRPLLDDQGRPQCGLRHLSGRVFFPPAWRMRGRGRMPIVIYSHGTSLPKDAVASEFGGHEWIFGAAAAAYYGFAVAMPDQPGMGGDGTDFHPFCHGKSLAYAIVDSIPAIRRTFEEDPCLVENGYAWDGRIFLVGYSEGGYASLAAAREMETHREAFGGEGNFMLAGSACMAGPFDISDTTRHQILAPDKAFPYPFFIPYVILGYHAVYGRIMDPLDVFPPDLLRSGEDGNLLEWSNGTRDGLAVDAALARRMGVAPGGVVLRDLLAPSWRARELEDPGFRTSPLRGILQENDVAVGWTPTRPILFCQSPDDDTVPIQNTLAARASLAAALREAGGNPAKLLHLKLLGRPGEGISHVTGAFLAIPAAFDWIYRGMPPEEAEGPAPALPSALQGEGDPVAP